MYATRSFQKCEQKVQTSAVIGDLPWITARWRRIRLFNSKKQRVLLEKTQLHRQSKKKKIFCIYEIRSFITTLTLVHIQNQVYPFQSHASHVRSILLLSSHLYLGLRNGFFFTCFPIEILICRQYMPHDLSIHPTG